MLIHEFSKISLPWEGETTLPRSVTLLPRFASYTHVENPGYATASERMFLLTHQNKMLSKMEYITIFVVLMVYTYTIVSAMFLYEENPIFFIL